MPFENRKNILNETDNSKGNENFNIVDKTTVYFHHLHMFAFNNENYQCAVAIFKGKAIKLVNLFIFWTSFECEHYFAISFYTHINKRILELNISFMDTLWQLLILIRWSVRVTFHREEEKLFNFYFFHEVINWFTSEALDNNGFFRQTIVFIRFELV